MKNFKLYVALVALFAFTITLGPSIFYQHFTRDTLTAEVTDTERSCHGSEGECTWLVLTDETSFENKDAFWHLKFNSTDLQGKMKIGHKYTFDYYGWRIPIFSMYPNLVSVKEVMNESSETH